MDTDFLGNEGAILSSYLISKVFDGETNRVSLREEFKGAIDLTLNFNDFYSNSQRKIEIQVKTGRSYVNYNKTNSCYSLTNIKPEYKDKWKKNNVPVLLLWVDPSNSYVYWKIYTKKTSDKDIRLSKQHLLRPDSRFEIERFINFYILDKKKCPKININQNETLIDTRKEVRKKFKKIRGIHNTTLGNIKVSEYCWKHVTRISRNKSHIKDTLTIIPYLKQILDLVPHQLQTVSYNESSTDNQTILRKKILAIYRNINFSDQKNCTVYIRFDETTIFPSNWDRKILQKEDIKHSIRVESFYRKNQKKDTSLSLYPLNISQ